MCVFHGSDSHLLCPGPFLSENSMRSVAMETRESIEQMRKVAG